ncbi:MAG: hypothetical protein B6U72_07625 [Candidatus Altiarchaeales archaeon ex4484_2]|nr:MAG: hypothetical protein B6U72_07625 [Candidatus Altiarchaeales archaeon ex4484_2]
MAPLIVLFISRKETMRAEIIAISVLARFIEIMLYFLLLQFDRLTFTQNRFTVCTVKEGNHMYQGMRGNLGNEILVLIPSGVSSLSLSLEMYFGH